MDVGVRSELNNTTPPAQEGSIHDKPSHRDLEDPKTSSKEKSWIGGALEEELKAANLSSPQHLPATTDVGKTKKRKRSPVTEEATKEQRKKLKKAKKMKHRGELCRPGVGWGIGN
jgi:hypothetical protein